MRIWCNMHCSAQPCFCGVNIEISAHQCNGEPTYQCCSVQYLGTSALRSAVPTSAAVSVNKGQGHGLLGVIQAHVLPDHWIEVTAWEYIFHSPTGSIDLHRSTMLSVFPPARECIYLLHKQKHKQTKKQKIVAIQWIKEINMILCIAQLIII